MSPCFDPQSGEPRQLTSPTVSYGQPPAEPHLPQADPVSPLSRRSSGDLSTPSQPDTHNQDQLSDIKPGSPLQATADVEESPQNTSSLENFFDVLEEELLFRQEGKGRKTDVLIYQGFEHTRDRLADRQCFTQYWHCRHRMRHKCKARLTLRVTNLEDITHNSTVANYTPHSHPPYRMKSYGTVDVSVIHSTDGSIGDATANTDHSNHAISQLSEGDFARDFDEDNLTSKASSSPTAGDQVRRSSVDDPLQEAAGGTASVEITTLQLDTSERDARGYPIQKFIPCQRRYKNQVIKQQRNPGEDSSDQ